MSEWREKTLNELGKVSRGKSRHRPRNAEFLYGGPYPFVQTSDIKNANFIISEYTQTYSEDGLKQSKLWPINTLCITIAANIADTAILGFEGCFPDSIMGFIPFENVSDVRFVKYCFDILQIKIKQISQGTAQDNLSVEKLLTVKFQVPDYPTQKRIASILSAYDDLIENNLKRIKLLEELAQRTYEEWFVKFKINGKQLEIGENGLPDGWQKHRADKTIELISGYAFRGNELMDIPTRNIAVRMGNFKVGGGLKFEKSKYLIDTKNIKEKHSLKPFDLVMVLSDVTREGLLIGNVGFIPDDRFNYYLNQRVSKIVVAEDLKYVIHANLNSKTFKQNCLKKANSVTVLNLKNEDINDYLVTIPPPDIIRLWNDLYGKIIQLMLNLELQNNHLKVSRDILLPRLMNGTIDVSGEVMGMVAEASEGYAK